MDKDRSHGFFSLFVFPFRLLFALFRSCSHFSLLFSFVPTRIASLFLLIVLCFEPIAEGKEKERIVLPRRISGGRFEYDAVGDRYAEDNRIFFPWRRRGMRLLGDPNFRARMPKDFNRFHARTRGWGSIELSSRRLARRISSANSLVANHGCVTKANGICLRRMVTEGETGHELEPG